MEPILNPESISTESVAMEYPADEGSVKSAEAPPVVAAEQNAEALPTESSSQVVAQSADNASETLPQNQNQSVIEYLERFEAQLGDHLRNNASCSRTAFDNLYEEMQDYKRNFLREAQRPLLLDLMMLYDSIDKLRRNYEQASSVDPVTLCQNLDALQVEAEEILGRVGIERMAATPDKLDVNFQRAVKTIPTDNPEEHLLVVEQLVSGFVSGGQPLRKEQVVVKKYTSRAPSAVNIAE